MEGLAQRFKAVSRNVANADTPGYTRRNVSFEDQLRDVIQSGKKLRMTVTDPAHIPTRPEISQTIKLIANIKESTLYPILKKLEASGFLTTYSREFQGRMRKYYSLTNRGVEQLVTLKEEWTLYTDTVNGIIEGSIRHDKN